MSKRKSAEDEETAAVVRALLDVAARDEAAGREIGPFLEEYARADRELKRLEWYSPWRLVFLGLLVLVLVALVEIVAGAL